MLVSAKREVVVKDACILFDLMDLDLLQVFFRLPLFAITTPQVLAEINDAGQLTQVNEYIESGHLEVDGLGSFETLFSITETHRALSFADASVLEAAIRRKAVILSSDKSLRNESAREGLIVHGLLWVMEELYDRKIIELDVLTDKLNAYPLVNVRAPKNEIEKLLKKYNT